MNDKSRNKAELIRELTKTRQELAAAQQALQDQQEWLHCFIESASDGFLLLDSNMCIVDVQRRQLEQVSRMDAKKVIGKPLDEISPGSKTDGRFDQFKEVLRTGQPLYIEDYVPTDPPPGYSERRCSLRAFRVGDKVLVVFTDITERLRSEDVLKESESRYRLLADNVKDIIWTVDNNNRITYVSPSAKGIIGYDAPELIGKHISFLMPADLTYEPLGSRMLVMKKYERYHSQSWKVETDVVTKEGDTVWTESTLSYLHGPDGKTEGVVGVTRDIRDRKSAEDLFRTLAGSSAVGVYIVQNRRFQFANRSFQEYVGRTAQDLASLNPVSFILRQDRRSARDHAIRMLKGHRRSPYEFRFIGKGGKVRWAIERVASVEFNGARAVLGNLMDVTEHKRSEEALARSERELRRLSKRILQIQEEERGHIARELHDQLGQEIFALHMEAEGLVDKLRSGSDTRRRAEALVDMISQLRVTSRRIAASARPAIIDDLGLTQAIQRYAEDFERRSGISCPVQASQGDLTPPRATAIVAFRIVQEALTNVWKHANASQVNVTIRSNRTMLTISVSDDGVGMNISPSSGSPSLGMRGMAERAKLVGGSLKIRSSPGRGCTVLARLPMKSERESPGTDADGKRQTAHYRSHR